MARRLTELERQLREITEEQLAQWIWDIARPYGWKVAHFRPARTKYGWVTPAQFDGAGWPDLVLLRGHQSIAAELKREIGPGATDAQQEWLVYFRAAGFEVFVWRPHDRPAILELLSGGQQRDTQLSLVGGVK
jgi:hypothetical protein